MGKLLLEEADPVVARLRELRVHLMLGARLQAFVEKRILGEYIRLVDLWQVLVGQMPPLVHDFGLRLLHVLQRRHASGKIQLFVR